MIFRLFSPLGHGQCKAMRYISKHEADVYLDKRRRKKTHSEENGLDSSVFFKYQAWMTTEPNLLLAQCCGMELHLFSFPPVFVEDPDATSLFPQGGKNKEIDNNLKQFELVKTARFRTEKFTSNLSWEPKQHGFDATILPLKNDCKQKTTDQTSTHPL